MATIFRIVTAWALVIVTFQAGASAQTTDSTSDQQVAQKRFELEKSTPQAKSKLPKNVASLVRALPNETVIGIIVLDRRGRVVFQHNSELELPAASSVKSILLLELFATFADELDTTDRDDIKQIVTNSKHPAIAHFGAKSKKLIAEGLAGVSIKQLGSILIDYRDQAGTKYSNAVYNAASNVAIALLGGPEGTTAKIHNRHKSFQDVHFRRYMLADRNVSGDNTASPLALATLFHVSVGKSPQGVKARTAKEVSKILHSVDYKNGAKLYSKGGTLHSDPVTQVRSGQYRRGKIRMNYAIMAKQTLRSKSSGKQQYDQLKKLTGDVYSGLKDPK